MAVEASAIALIQIREIALKQTSTNNPGFDLYEGDSIEHASRLVEVKSVKGKWVNPVTLSLEQFRVACRKRRAYWLYVVEHASDPEKSLIHRIQDPVSLIKYFTFDPGWKAVARGRRNWE